MYDPTGKYCVPRCMTGNYSISNQEGIQYRLYEKLNYTRTDKGMEQLVYTLYSLKKA